MTGGVHRYLDYLFYMPQWNIGIVESSLDAVVGKGELPRVKWWKRGGNAVFNADPFFLGDEIVFERMNRWRGKAELWVAKVDGSSRRRFVRRPDHISYPCVTEISGRTFLVFEAASSGVCTILERRGERWLTVASIAQPIVDGTLLFQNGLWWLFGTLADGTENDALHIWWSEAVEGPWRAHKMNPVKRDSASSRPAGRFHGSKMGLIRPAQDCSSTYGGGIALCRVDRLDEGAFEEVVLLRLQPQRQYPHGIHTINSRGERLVIDGKRKAFHPLAAFLKWNSRSRKKPTRPDEAVADDTPIGGGSAGDPRNGGHVDSVAGN